MIKLSRSVVYGSYPAVLCASRQRIFARLTVEKKRLGSRIAGDRRIAFAPVFAQVAMASMARFAWRRHRDSRRHGSTALRPDRRFADTHPGLILAYKISLDLDAKTAKSIHARRTRLVRLIEP